MKREAFTLVELMVSLALFAGIMALLMQYFVSAQKIWISSAAKTEMFENARVALDLMENDLSCAYYSYGHDNTKIFFYPQGSSKQIGFAVTRPAPPNKSCVSYICEVQYKLDLGNAKARLLMNVAGDSCADGSSNANWDVTSFASAVSSSSNPFTTYDSSVYDTASPSVNLDGWCEVIPYVVNFSFTLYDKQGNLIASDTGANFLAQSDKMPYTVVFSITLVDRDAFSRYFSLHPSADLSSSASYNSFMADSLIAGSLRTFTRQVTVERGQYD